KLRTQLSAVWKCRTSAPFLVFFQYRSVDARLSLYLTAFGNADMANHTYLSPQNHVLTNLGTPGNSGLRCNNRIRSHLHIMRDLDQVIQFNAFQYPCRT